VSRIDAPSAGTPTTPATRATRTARPRRIPKTRLDQLLVERGLAETRTRAQALLMAGSVRVGEGDGARTNRKGGDMVDPATPLAVTAALPYVSRGGEKLAGALDAFGVDPTALICLDAGASTGGFTDALLQRGAARVHAVDVGRGQLAASIAADPRVVVHDRVNARHLEPAVIGGERAQLAVIDVSFISLGLVLGPVASCLAPGSRVVALVKPQFEAGRKDTPGGVVRDPAVHRAVLEKVVDQARALGLRPLDVCRSPLTGPAGNVEFFLLAAVEGPAGAAGEPAEPIDLAERIAAVVP
jgi:23S rRNA (cytidine1920-2'-O)/16S rRNA (cytidine1409-2'-O)-methyltransferase